VGSPSSTHEIGVVVKDGIVTLTGWVDSYTKRWAAEEAALRVKGVKGVANEIEVRLPASSERTDADIAAAAITRSRVGCLHPRRQCQSHRLQRLGNTRRGG